MPSLALGLGLSKNKTAVYSGLKLDAQAVAHYDRVIADGGIMPAGLLGCNAWFVAVKAVYGATDITTAISAGYDPLHLGAKIGAGMSGAGLQGMRSILALTLCVRPCPLIVVWSSKFGRACFRRNSSWPRKVDGTASNLRLDLWWFIAHSMCVGPPVPP